MHRALPILIALVLWMTATAASAFNITHIIRGGMVGPYGAGDSLIVDVFLDADQAGLTVLSTSVDVDASVLTYNPVASVALPIIYPAPPTSLGTNGSQPGYILDSSPASRPLYPQQSPFSLWPLPPPGREQVNINYAESLSQGSAATGFNIWIASLVFDVDADFVSSDINLSVTGGGNIVTQYGFNDITAFVSVSSPITIVPEAATSLLLGLSLAGIGRLRRLES